MLETEIPPRVLVVDDDEDGRQILVGALKRRQIQAEGCGTVAGALERVRAEDYDVILADVELGDEMSGIQMCQAITEIRPHVPVIVVTAHGSMDVAVAAIRAGAYDFITKPLTADAVGLAIARATQHKQLRTEITRLREEVSGKTQGITTLVGDSEPIRRVVAVVEQVAASDATVLITGESGTGKELVARALHDRSSRKKEPFVAINCAAMPATLLESELFGYVRGAFTDAKKDRAGLFVQAGGGTLFLDEIGEMPLEMQVKLLRVLQERKVRPVGGDDELSFRARLVTATNRDLESEIEENRFRSDLYYRVNVVHIEVPPLRARQGDILLLAQYFLKRHAERNNRPVVSLSLPAARKLLDYEWPGNVRELENSMERAVALTRFSEIGVEDLPEKIRSFQPSQFVISVDNPEEMLTLDEMERRYVRKVLLSCGGNKSQAARVLGLDRRTLYRRLESLNIAESSEQSKQVRT